MRWRRKWQPTPVFLPGESQGRGAWWAALYGITQSQTPLKRLSSSSSSSLGFIPLGTLWVSWTWVSGSFPILGKFSTIISSSIFSRNFFLSSSSGTPVIRMLGPLTLFQRSLRLFSFLLILFFFYPLCFIYFHHSVFHLTYPLFCLSYSTVGSLQSAFDLSYCIIHYWLILLYFF